MLIFLSIFYVWIVLLCDAVEVNILGYIISSYQTLKSILMRKNSQND